MTEAILAEFGDQIAGLKLVPAGGGRYEVTVNGELVFSKLEARRFPETDEIKEKLRAKA